MLDYLGDDFATTEELLVAAPPTLLEQRKNYKSLKNDEVDAAMARIINTNGIRLPIIRMGEGKYLIGTESKIAIIKGNSCVVRVGGGFENMEAWIVRNENE